MDTLPYLCASLAYHADWLSANLHRRHPLFRTYIWTSGFLDNAKQHVILGNHRCEVTNVRASGIPPFMMVARQIYDMGEKMLELTQTVEKNNQAAMARFNEVVATLPKALGDYVLSHCEVGGAVPVSADLMVAMFADMRTSLSNELRSMINDVTGLANSTPQAQTNLTVQEPAVPTSIEIEGHVWQIFVWGNKFRPVPSDFTFASMSTKVFWDHWFFGNISTGIRPYKWLQKGDLPLSKDQTKLTKGRVVVGNIIQRAESLGGLPHGNKNISLLTMVEANGVFSLGFNNIVQQLEHGHPADGSSFRRYGEMAYTTVYKLLKE